MNVSLPLAEVARPRADTVVPKVKIPQCQLHGIFAVWAVAALPMAVLAWVVAPALAQRLSGEGDVPMVKAVCLCLVGGLIWQFVLVAVLVGREQGTLRGQRSATHCGCAHHAVHAAAASAARSG